MRILDYFSRSEYALLNQGPESPDDIIEMAEMSGRTQCTPSETNLPDQSHVYYPSSNLIYQFFICTVYRMLLSLADISGAYNERLEVSRNLKESLNGDGRQQFVALKIAQKVLEKQMHLFSATSIIDALIATLIVACIWRWLRFRGLAASNERSYSHVAKAFFLTLSFSFILAGFAVNLVAVVFLKRLLGSDLFINEV